MPPSLETCSRDSAACVAAVVSQSLAAPAAAALLSPSCSLTLRTSLAHSLHPLPPPLHTHTSTTCTAAAVDVVIIHPSAGAARSPPFLSLSLASRLSIKTQTHTHAADSFSLALSLAHRSQVAVDRSRHLLTARLSLTLTHSLFAGDVSRPSGPVGCVSPASGGEAAVTLTPSSSSSSYMCDSSSPILPLSSVS